MMGKSKALSQDLCSLVVAKHTDGIGYRRISKLLNVPVSTVGTIILDVMIVGSSHIGGSDPVFVTLLARFLTEK
ncbi:unnamed protein product [Staurois parvus]|uniref:Sleeping Beauty transposase HTH domain-containing protein n=1 Tax=Staurois parvus TaxID=386267 RepID=A0ABN9A827_9NEOB|nr:unnamed protein product [Staurois parvus]